MLPGIVAGSCWSLSLLGWLCVVVVELVQVKTNLPYLVDDTRYNTNNHNTHGMHFQFVANISIDSHKHHSHSGFQ